MASSSVPTVGPGEVARMTTAELRRSFLVDSLFRPGELRLVQWEVDRTVIGGAVPRGGPLRLEDARAFCERRELGIFNLDAPGTVEVDGREFRLEPLDVLYVGRGAAGVSFRGDGSRFYLVSYPAHADHPTRLARRSEARELRLGTGEGANRRVIRQYVHPEGVASCQLVLGYTELESGSVWNTFPPHTHGRRNEVYLYFNLGPEGAIFHTMGRPDETRHVVAREGEAVLCPPWSVHFGCGTGPYRFVWSMGGENQEFDDMDGVAVGELR